jgi:hypothetical protein
MTFIFRGRQKMIPAMYSPEKLKELEAMDNETFLFYFKNGPKPNWTKEQWAEVRRYQSMKLSKRKPSTRI